MIISWTKVFIIFLGLVQPSTIIGMLSSFCTRYRYNYIRRRSLCKSRIYFDISSSGSKRYFTIDTRDMSDLGPAKFRTQVDGNKEQIFYYDRNKRDNDVNHFLVVRKQTSPAFLLLILLTKPIERTLFIST